MKLAVNRILALFPLLLLSAVLLPAQDALTKCRTTVKGGEYKWASMSAPEKEPSHISGNVLIAPENANPSHLERLAARLKQEYCHAQVITAVIFDSKDKLNYGWEIYNRDEKNVRWRAVYTYNKTKGIETLAFYDSSGDRRSEVLIDLKLPTRK